MKFQYCLELRNIIAYLGSIPKESERVCHARGRLEAEDTEGLFGTIYTIKTQIMQPILI